MGKRSDFERFPQDKYNTPEPAIAPLLPHLALETGSSSRASARAIWSAASSGPAIS